jgi:protein-tyrosine-phosphatase
MAEAVLERKGRDRYVVASAGASPASQVHPLALRVLRERGIDWSGRRPKGIEAVRDQAWDLVITVCDRTKEECPALPANPVFAHWGIPDPVAVDGTEEQRLHAFRDALTYLGRRIDLMLALPVEKVEQRATELRLEAGQSIGGDPPEPRW